MKRYIRRKQGLITALLLIIWTLIMIFIAYSDVTNERNQTEMLLVDHGRMLSMVIMTQWRWNSQHGGVYVLDDGSILPNPYLDENEHTITTSDGQRLVKLTHTWMQQEIGRIGDIEKRTDLTIVSTDPINPENSAVAWDTAAIEQFRQEMSDPLGPPPEVYSIDSKQLRYISPLVAETSCLTCHDNKKFNVGSIIGGLKLTIDAEPFMHWYRREVRQHMISLALLWIIGCVGITMIMRAIIRRINEELKLHTFKGVLEMAGSAAHELNQPLQIISGYAELLSVIDTNNYEEMKGMLTEIRQNIQRLAKVTRKLNNITRYETMKLSGNDRIIDLERAASDTESIYPVPPPDTV